MTNPRVLLTTLSARTSAKGRRYLAGWLGKASVVAFAGEPDRYGNPTWDVYLSEPEPPKAAARPPERDSTAGWPTPEPPSAGTRSGPPQRPFRHETEAERRQRVASTITAGCGRGEADP
jgi:hypothetical protein